MRGDRAKLTDGAYLRRLNSIKIQTKRCTSDDSKTALRDVTAVRARTQIFGVSGWHRRVRRSANARKYRDYSGDRRN
jgi:hypothetical protein